MQLPTFCFTCQKEFYRSARQINENAKLHFHNYCSRSCLNQSKQRRKILRCENPTCQRTFERLNSDITDHNFCSHACANFLLSQKLKKVKHCPSCNGSFFGPNKYCGTDCIPKTLSKYSRSTLLTMLSDYYHQFGRVPVKREFNNHWQAYRRVFGSWNTAIKSAGLPPNPARFANKFVSVDGHKCDSLSEKIIDDWLNAKHIIHLRNHYYPTKDRFTVDFFVQNKYWIEFFGLIGQLSSYDKLHARKLKIAKRNNINIIEILPVDLFPDNKLSDKLGFLLKWTHVKHFP